MSSLDSDIDANRPMEATCDETGLRVRLADGRVIMTPLWWYPSLLQASPAQRSHMQLMVTGIHWPQLDEDISIAGMLKGWKHPDAQPPAEAAE